MIKLSTITILFTILFSASYGQNGFQDKTKIGFIVGPSLNTLKTTEMNESYDYSYSDKGSFGFGVQMITKFSDQLSFEYGVISNRINTERIDNCTDCTENVSRTNSFSFKYITIPIHAQYYFQNDRLDIFGIGGISANILANSKGSYLTASGKEFDLIDIEDASKNVFNFEIGAGINYNLTYRGSFGLNVIYQKGINSISSAPSTSFSGISIQPGLFYQF
ncbi:MAG: opacity protein-like surface antigen [Parvicella sp.]|jgi:opacity protein-like surface antigen